MSDDRKDLPTPGAPNFNERVRETLSTYLGKRGDPLDRGVTLRDLSDAGIVSLTPGYLARPGSYRPVAGAGSAVGTGTGTGTGTYEPDLTPPPTPTGFTVTPTFNNLIIEHDNPVYTQGHGHARTRVYGKTYSTGALPTFSTAVLITEFTGTVFAHPTTLGTEWHLWIKWVSEDGVESTTPAGGTNGLTATTGRVGNSDLGPLIVTADKLAGNIDAAKFAAGIEPVTIVTSGTLPTVKSTTFIYWTDLKLYRWNGSAYVKSVDGADIVANSIVAGQIGVGGLVAGAIAVGSAAIADGAIRNALIANLAVDNAKIADLSVGKLTAGNLQVGSYLRSTSYVPGASGWAINADGTAELGAAYIRGQLVASQIDTTNLTIKDGAGTVIFGAGTALDYSRIIADSRWLNSNVSISSGGALSGAGGGTVTIGGLDSTVVRSANPITSANVTTYIGNAAINLLQVNTGSFATLSALSSYLGTVEIATGGYLRSGQTAWSTGNGFWLGWIGSGPGEPGFSIGSSAAYLRYRPSTGLELKLDTFTVTFDSGSFSTGYTGNGSHHIGVLTASPNGGVSPYTYSWQVLSGADTVSPSPDKFTASRGAVVSDNKFDLYINSAAAAGAQVTQYATQTCTITDANGRTAGGSVTVTVLWNGGTP